MSRVKALFIYANKYNIKTALHPSVKSDRRRNAVCHLIIWALDRLFSLAVIVRLCAFGSRSRFENKLSVRRVYGYAVVFFNVSRKEFLGKPVFDLGLKLTS